MRIMDQLDFEPQPMKKTSPAKFLAFGATLFVALIAVVAAVVLPGMKTTDDRSKATSTASCSGSIVASAAICFEKCIADEDCSTGLKCQSVGTVVDKRCRNPLNPESSTCAGQVSPTTPAVTTPPGTPTRPPATSLPTAPPGCVYKQVQCIQAPCDPVLECSSPTATPTTKSHVVKLMNKPTGSTTIYMDFDAIAEDGVLTQETSSRFTYTGVWTVGSLSGLSGGANKFTGTSGGSVQFTTTAKTLAIYSTKQSNMGSIDVYVDGVLKTNVPMTASTSQYQQKIDLSSYLATVQPTNPPTPTPVPAVGHTVTFSFHRYTDGQNMAIDYIKDGTTVVDDSSSLITYSGTWYKGSDSSPYGGQYAATNLTGSAMSYKTTSKSIIVRPYRYPTRGGLDVYVDGVLKQQVNDLNSGSGWSDISVTVSP